MQYLNIWLISASGFFTEALACAELSAHSTLSLPQSMQIEPGLSWEGPDSIWIYWFNQLRVPYIVWSPPGIHWLNSWDSACAAKAENTGKKRMENFFYILTIAVQGLYWLVTLSGWCTLVYRIGYIPANSQYLFSPKDTKQVKVHQGTATHPSFLGEKRTADYLSIRPSLFCCRVGFKVTSDWEKWIICVYTWTDLQNLHFCDTN